MSDIHTIVDLGPVWPNLVEAGLCHDLTVSVCSRGGVTVSLHNHSWQQVEQVARVLGVEISGLDLGPVYPGPTDGARAMVSIGAWMDDYPVIPVLTWFTDLSVLQGDSRFWGLLG
jgi:hypothetical protein